MPTDLYFIIFVGLAIVAGMITTLVMMAQGGLLFTKQYKRGFLIGGITLLAGTICAVYAITTYPNAGISTFFATLGFSYSVLSLTSAFYSWRIVRRQERENNSALGAP